MMSIKSQKIGSEVLDNKTHTLILCQSYSDIGLVWKIDTLAETAAKLNTITNNTFTQKSIHEYYLKTKLMKKFKIKYTEDV